MIAGEHQGTYVNGRIVKWIERLQEKEGLQPVSDVDLIFAGPCPFLEHFGEPMWLARCWFKSTRPRLVSEDTVVATRRMAEDVGIPYEKYRNAAPRALPPDWWQQIQYVAEHQDEVYARQAEVARNEESIEGTPDD